jgi:hypothetical protein
MGESKGRPPKGPKSGKGATLATRITAETRAAIEAEAEHTGRSISQVTEIWLDEARIGRANYQAMLGGTQLASAIEKLVELARSVEQTVPAELRRQALIAAWEAALPAVIPSGPVGQELIDVETQRRVLAEAWETAMQVLEKADPDDPVRIYLKDNFTGALLDPLMVWAIPQFQDAVTALGAQGDTARIELEAVLKALKSATAAIVRAGGRVSEAQKLGRDIAVAHGLATHEILRLRALGRGTQ